VTGGSGEAQERITGLYEQHAAAWDRVRGRDPHLEKPWLDRFIATLPEQASILDLGCGSGQPIACCLVAAGFSVTGIDSSETMIKLCRARLPAHHWLVGDMRELALGRAFGGIIAWHSMFHLGASQQRAMFPRLAAHLGPGGVLMFTSGDAEGERIGEWEGEPLFHASLAPQEYEALLRENGFCSIERKLVDPDCGGACVWLAQMRPASGLDGSA
jgi:SAM-dependent methyltransferase